MQQKREPCLNYNHGRTNVPVHFCCMCGEVVNDNIPIKVCDESSHASNRRMGNKYCVNCGEELTKNRR